MARLGWWGPGRFDTVGIRMMWKGALFVASDGGMGTPWVGCSDSRIMYSERSVRSVKRFPKRRFQNAELKLTTTVARWQLNSCTVAAGTPGSTAILTGQ